MYKALTQRPLQQAMVLLWLLGALRLFGWLTHAPPSDSWVVSAGLAAVLLMLIGASLRLVVLVPVWVSLGWVAAIAGAGLLGVDTAAGIGTVTAIYALALWQITVKLVASSGLLQFAELLRLRGGYPAPGGRFFVERYVYWSSFALTLLALAIDILSAPLTFAVPAISWPVLGLALALLFLGGRRYSLALNTYLCVALTLLGAVSAFLFLTTGEAALSLRELSIGLILASAAVPTWLLSRWTERHTDERPVQRRLYVRPLRNSAAAMAMLAILQVLVLATALPAGPGWSAVIVLVVSSVVLLLTNRELLLPLFTAVAALSATWAMAWFHSALLSAGPPSELYPGGSAAGSQWLVAALWGFMLAAAGYGLYCRSRWRHAFGTPLLAIALSVFGWNLADALVLYTPGAGHLPWTIIVLIATLFPLLRPMALGHELRGVTVALLTTFLAAATLGPEGRTAFGGQALLTWAFILWLLGTLVLPRLNTYLSDWSVVPRTWPWLGLLVLGLGIVHEYRPGTFQWELCVIAAAYIFLMLRHHASAIFTWPAVAVLSLGAVLFSMERYVPAPARGEIPAATVGLALENLVWANVLLALVGLWDRYGPQLARRLHWREPALRPPLLFAAFALCTIWLSGLLLWDALLVADIELSAEPHLALVLGVALALSFLHGLIRWIHPLAAHAFLVAVVAAALAAWAVQRVFELPLALALISAVLTGAWTGTTGREAALLKPLNGALLTWVAATLMAGFLMLFLVRSAPIGEHLLTLGILAGVAGFSGWRQQSRSWIYVGGALAALLLHGVWLLWIPSPWIGALLPVYALQFALIAWGLRWLFFRLQRGGAHDRETIPGALAPRTISDFARAAAFLSVVEWAAHLVTVGKGLLAGIPATGLAEPWAHATAILTALVLATLCILQARRSRKDRWVYATALVVTITGVYCRLLWVGLAPVSVWDTGAILVTGYLLFSLQALTGSRPMFILTLTLPLTALFTVPFQLGSTHAALSLFALGALYFLTQRSTGAGTPLYLALLAINTGIYLWVPGWSTQFGLLQVYVIPAALTVLLLLHLHRDELKPDALYGARLSALSMLYAAATLDVFLQESLWIFVLALALSLAGVVLGILSRTRAFLYAGTVFLVINVLGQLLQLYPEQRLGRALVLMILGAGVTGSMIWFNLKRDAILQRVRIMRADLATWA